MNSILLVGESHYLPHGSSLHLSPESWYSSDYTSLNNEEIKWISTASIYKNAMKENFSNKAHSIWGNSLWELNNSGPGYGDYRRAATHIAAYNFFFRPAVEGESLDVADQDIEVANRGFQYLLDQLNPTAVVFLSRLAHENLAINPAQPSICTQHPGSAWWNRPSQINQNRNGRQVLADFISTLPWPASNLKSP